MSGIISDPDNTTTTAWMKGHTWALLCWGLQSPRDLQKNHADELILLHGVDENRKKGYITNSTERQCRNILQRFIARQPFRRPKVILQENAETQVLFYCKIN